MAGNVFSRAKSFFSKIKGWIIFLVSVLIITYLLINIGSGVYTLLTECWVCEVFTNIYDAFSKVSYNTFTIFQNDALVVLSVCLALWIVYETYKIFIKGVSINPQINIYGE